LFDVDVVADWTEALLLRGIESGGASFAGAATMAVIEANIHKRRDGFISNTLARLSFNETIWKVKSGRQAQVIVTTGHRGAFSPKTLEKGIEKVCEVRLFRLYHWMVYVQRQKMYWWRSEALRLSLLEKSR
jgi:hypothetical protein